MSRAYRGRYEIAADILRYAKESPVLVTHIMYATNLSFAQIKQYIPLLTESRLLARNGEDRHYSITPAGSDFLKKYEVMAGMIKGGGRQTW